MAWKNKKYVWLLADAAAALTDQILDMIMLGEYAANDDWDFFLVGLCAILLPSLLLGLFGLVFGSSYAAHERLVLCCNFFPGINLVANAARLLRAFLGENFERRGEDWVERWYNKYEEEYVFARFAEAMLEAGPQTALQAFVALRRPEGINGVLLYSSMAFSVLSISKTLVMTLVFGRVRYNSGDDFENDSDNDSWNEAAPDSDDESVEELGGETAAAPEDDSSMPTSMSYPERVRMFLLSFSYEACEVVSRVFSVSLLGYFCGGHIMAAFLAGEYVLLFAILTARGACAQTSCGEGAGRALRVLSLPLLLLVTSLMCSREFPFRAYLPLRALVLGAYAAASVEVRREGADLEGIAAFFFWAAAVATAAWILLMPAFVGSCGNLGVSLNYTGFKPKAFIHGCRYPLEVRKDDDTGGDTCGCLYNKKAAEVVDKTTDAVEIVTGSCN